MTERRRVHHWQTTAGESGAHRKRARCLVKTFCVLRVCVSVSERMWQEVAENYEKDERLTLY